jgi:hypothetical protein
VLVAIRLTERDEFGKGRVRYARNPVEASVSPDGTLIVCLESGVFETYRTDDYDHVSIEHGR